MGQYQDRPQRLGQRLRRPHDGRSGKSPLEREPPRHGQDQRRHQRGHPTSKLYFWLHLWLHLRASRCGTPNWWHGESGSRHDERWRCHGHPTRRPPGASRRCQAPVRQEMGGKRGDQHRDESCSGTRPHHRSGNTSFSSSQRLRRRGDRARHEKGDF